MPVLSVTPLVNVLFAVSVSCEVALFWDMPVTFVPTGALIVVVPVPAPMLVTVPALFTAVVERVMVPVVALVLIVRLLGPVTPPLNVVETAVPVFPIVNTAFVVLANAI